MKSEMMKLEAHYPQREDLRADWEKRKQRFKIVRLKSIWWNFYTKAVVRVSIIRKWNKK